MAGLPSKFWLVIFVVLILLLVSGGIILGINLYSHRPVEISLTRTTLPDYPLEIFICGAVQNPGYYPAAIVNIFEFSFEYIDNVYVFDYIMHMKLI